MDKPVENQKRKSNKRPKTREESYCQICGSSALYSYFGVIACIPCKMFFKRNAEHGKDLLKCDFDGNCEINVNNRHVCSYCRLMKCFNCGMDIERMRASIPKQKKINDGETTTTVVVRPTTFEQFPTLNLLRSDSSMLTIDQWNLISNISNCYDEYSGFSMGERFVREQNSLPMKFRLKGSVLIEFTRMALDGLRLLYEKNEDFASLSFDDRSILLHQTYKYTGCLATNFILCRVGVTKFPMYYDAIAPISTPGAVNAARRLEKQLHYDLIIHKLLLAIVSFSTIDLTNYSKSKANYLSNVKQLVQLQDRYIELLWKYLLYRHSFKEAVQQLSMLLQCLMTSHEMIVKLEEIQWYNEQTDSLAEQTERNLVLHN